MLIGIKMFSSQWGGAFWHELVAQPLFIPGKATIPLGYRVGHAQPPTGEREDNFAKVADGEDAMRRLRERLEAGYLDILDSCSTLEGRLAKYQESLDADPDNINYWEGVAGLAVLLDDSSQVEAARQGAQRALEVDDRDWVRPIHDRTVEVCLLYRDDRDLAVAELRRRADQERARALGG
jgi:tetratricopeptide (TPR) repeat protein